MSGTVEPTPFKAWKRQRPTGAGEGEPERPLMCGGPDLTVDERFELMRQKQREMDEAKRKEREEAEAEAKAEEAAKRRKALEEEDEYLVAERMRNDRYSVTLLKSDDSAWGGSSAGSGVLG